LSLHLPNAAPLGGDLPEASSIADRRTRFFLVRPRHGDDGKPTHVVRSSCKGHDQQGSFGTRGRRQLRWQSGSRRMHRCHLWRLHVSSRAVPSHSAAPPLSASPVDMPTQASLCITTQATDRRHRLSPAPYGLPANHVFTQRRPSASSYTRAQASTGDGFVPRGRTEGDVHSRHT
jgi:hypothetical protein